MSAAVLVTMLRQSGRNLRHGGLPFFFAIVMTGLGLFGLATFATVLLNLERVTDRIENAVGAVAFLDAEAAADAEEARAKIELLPGVAGATLVTPEEALRRVKAGLGDAGDVLATSGGVRMPYVVEIRPDLAAEVPRDALLKAVRKTKGVDEVMHPGGDLSRISALMRVLRLAGVFLSLLIALVTIVVVSNTIKLTLFARRDEIQIMKLVGATDLFVRVPFVVGGLVQGIVGAILALAGLAAAHASLAGLLGVALSGTFGAFELLPLPLAGAIWLILGGGALGAFGALVSIGRFLRV